MQSQKRALYLGLFINYSVIKTMYVFPRARAGMERERREILFAMIVFIASGYIFLLENPVLKFSCFILIHIIHLFVLSRPKAGLGLRLLEDRMG